ncbi:MAG: PepSY domain-containing protein [Deltaproteobacteria bacterium]
MILSLAVLISALIVPSPAGRLLADSSMCIDDWSTAVPVVKEEGLAPVETVTRLAKTRLQGAIVKVTLCKLEERYVYRLLVRSSNGKMAPVFVDAKEPFGR